jgi:sugar phosphate isomerase/epimerase
MVIVMMVLCSGGHAYSQRNTLGIIAPLDNDSLMYASGFRLNGATVGSTLSPTLSEDEFLERVEVMKKTRCKVYLCNVLFPGSLKIAGPDVDEKQVLDYLDKVVTRAERAEIQNLTLGSGGARRLPEGYDKTKATDDFIVLAGKMAVVAKAHGVTIILENLNSTETNFITKLREAAEIVRRVDHPNFRLNADIYHMLKENESAEEIKNAGKLIVYCEIAEKQNRALPGVSREDFRPYLSALKDIKYKGPILIEGNSDNFKRDIPLAFQYLSRQLQEVYGKKPKQH